MTGGLRLAARPAAPGPRGGPRVSEIGDRAPAPGDKEPEHRYGSAEELAEDLRRHLERLPVVARPPTLAYRTARFLRRQWLGAAAAALILVSLLGGIVATAHQAQIARQRGLTAERTLGFLVELYESADPDRNAAGTLTLRDVLDAGETRLAQLADEPLAQATLMDTLGETYRKLAVVDRAAPLLREAVEIRRRHLRSPHPDLATSIGHLSLLRHDQGELEEAERLLREALDLRRRHFGASHREVAASLHTVGHALFSRSRYREAAAAVEEALAMRRRLLGDRHADVATSLHLLALIHRRQGDLDRAETLFEEALAMRREVLGQEHWRVDQHPDQPRPGASRARRLRPRRGALSASLADRAQAPGRAHLGRAHPQQPGGGAVEKRRARRGRSPPPGVARHADRAPGRGPSERRRGLPQPGPVPARPGRDRRRRGAAPESLADRSPAPRRRSSQRRSGGFEPRPRGPCRRRPAAGGGAPRAGRGRPPAVLGSGPPAARDGARGAGAAARRGRRRRGGRRAAAAGEPLDPRGERSGERPDRRHPGPPRRLSRPAGAPRRGRVPAGARASGSSPSSAARTTPRPAPRSGACGRSAATER